MAIGNGFDQFDTDRTGPGQELIQITNLLRQLQSYENNSQNAKVTEDLGFLTDILAGNLPRNFLATITPVIFGSLQYNDPSPEGPDLDVLFIGDGQGCDLWWLKNNRELKDQISTSWPIGKKRDFDIHYTTINKVTDDYLASIILSGKPLFAGDSERLRGYRERINRSMALDTNLRGEILLTLRDTLDYRIARKGVR